MEDQFERTEKLIGRQALQKLKASRVAVFGIGGVGGSCAEALARMGIGSIGLFDNDVVTLTNLNRQIVALHSTIGRCKTDVMAERICDINPECKVGTHKVFYSPETAGDIDLSEFDYIVDAIDTVSSKIELITRAKQAGVKIICAMGAGNRMDPAKFVVTDIHKTEMDPLAKAVRKELRSRGINNVKVVCSTEPQRNSSRPPASNSFVPPAMGLILAAEVIKELIKELIVPQNK
jgi:tRNA A37 threonylcarbamoyladenosine dehydratase